MPTATPSRTGRYLGGLALGYVHQIVSVLVSFWLTPFLLRHLGPRDYGLWLVASQIVAFFSLADLGVVALLPRETAYVVGRAGGWQGASELPALIARTAWIVLFQLPLVAAAAALTWFLLPADWSDLRRPLAIVLVVFVAAFPLRILGAVLLGLQDLAFCSAVQSITFLASSVTAVALVVHGFGLEAVALSWVVLQAGGILPALLRLVTRFPGVLPRSVPAITLAETRRHLASGVWFSVGNLGMALLAGTDLLLVGKIWGAAAVFPLACTAKLVSFLANQPSAVLYAAASGLSEVKVAAPERMLSVHTALSQVVLLLSGAIACVVLPINRGFVQWWIGADAWGGLALTAALLALMVLRHWNTTNVFALVCFGRERRVALTQLADGVVTVSASCVLISLLGRVGAPLGALVGLLLVSLPSNLLGVAEENRTSVVALMRALVPWALRFVVVLALAAAVAKLHGPEGVPRIVACAAGFGVLYGVVMLPLLRRAPLGGYLRDHLPRLWRLVPGSRAALEPAPEKAVV